MFDYCTEKAKLNVAVDKLRVSVNEPPSTHTNSFHVGDLPDLIEALMAIERATYLLQTLSRYKKAT